MHSPLLVNPTVSRKDLRLILALIALGLLASPGKAVLAANKDLPNYSLKDDVPDTGTSFRRNIVGGAIVPLDKRYSELSVEEKAVLKSQYDGIGLNDEPPFPVDGLLTIYRLVADGQRRLQVAGSMVLSVDVDSGGDATSVSAPKSADADMVSLVASVLLSQKYKPGTCNGIPCNMQFPIRFDFTRRH